MVALMGIGVKGHKRVEVVYLRGEARIWVYLSTFLPYREDVTHSAAPVKLPRTCVEALVEDPPG